MREAAQEPGAWGPIQQAWLASSLSWGQGCFRAGGPGA